MTSRYILDENVVIFAQNGRDEYENPSRICSDLVDKFSTAHFGASWWMTFYGRSMRVSYMTLLTITPI